jgi:hypothetical protein
MDIGVSRTLVAAAVVGSIACGGSGAKGTETPLVALQGKTLDLSVAWERKSAANSTRVGSVSVRLTFSDVSKSEGDACPIVHASATFGGATLTPGFHGGTDECGLFGDPGCGQTCLWVDWDADDITALLEALPQTVDLILQDGSETAVVTVRNPAPMATVTVLDLVEGQQVRYGDSFHVQLQPQPPATIEDIQGGFYVHMSEAGGGLPRFPDVASGSNVWLVNIVPLNLAAGPLTLQFGAGIQSLHFDSCPSDFTCSGGSRVDFGQFALQYLP